MDGESLYGRTNSFWNNFSGKSWIIKLRCMTTRKIKCFGITVSLYWYTFAAQSNLQPTGLEVCVIQQMICAVGSPDWTSSHVKYVLECVGKTYTKIRNMRGYLLQSLYNAPDTIDFYYAQKATRLCAGI